MSGVADFKGVSAFCQSCLRSVNALRGKQRARPMRRSARRVGRNRGVRNATVFVYLVLTALALLPGLLRSGLDGLLDVPGTGRP